MVSQCFPWKSRNPSPSARFDCNWQFSCITVLGSFGRVSSRSKHYIAAVQSPQWKRSPGCLLIISSLSRRFLSSFSSANEASSLGTTSSNQWVLPRDSVNGCQRPIPQTTRVRCSEACCFCIPIQWTDGFWCSSISWNSYSIINITEIKFIKIYIYDTWCGIQMYTRYYWIITKGWSRNVSWQNQPKAHRQLMGVDHSAVASVVAPRVPGVSLASFFFTSPSTRASSLFCISAKRLASSRSEWRYLSFFTL